MKPNIWPKLNEIHQRWLTHERIVDLLKDVINAIQNDDKESLKNIPQEIVNGASFYNAKHLIQTNILNTSINGHPSCLSPRPQTPPTNIYPTKTPRSPRRNFNNHEFKTDRNQTVCT